MFMVMVKGKNEEGDMVDSVCKDGWMYGRMDAWMKYQKRKSFYIRLKGIFFVFFLSIYIEIFDVYEKIFV